MGKIIDLTGQNFGRLTVIKQAEKPEGTKAREAFWECQCTCGKTIISRGSNLRNGNTKSCGCLQKEKTSQMKKLNLTGKTFGKLTVLKENGRTKDGRVLWECQCSCGNKINAITNNLTAGKTTSCGCNRQKDIKNQIFNDYQAIERLDKKASNGSYYWKIKCIYCGDEKEVPINRLSQELMMCSCHTEKGKSKYEQIILDILNYNNIPYIKEKTFSNLINPKTNKHLRCDFYVNNSYIIEVDGEQHFKEGSGFFEKYSLKEIQYLDNLKNQWCKDNNIPIIRIPYYEINKQTIELKDLLPQTSKFLIHG